MNKANVRALLCGTALGLGGSLSAQEAVELDTLVLSGSLTPVEAEATGTSITVIDGDQIGQETELSRTLDRLAGVNTVSNGGVGTLSTIQVRGLQSRYVGTRINGINVADPSGVYSEYNFGGLTGAGLGRVEVLRGSQSALYGSEAIGGVVDITTWRPEREGWSTAATAEYGSFETLQGSLSLGYLGDRAELALTYGQISSAGISALAEDDEKDGFDQESLSFYGAYDVAPGLTFGATGIFRDYEIEIDQSPTNPAFGIALDNTGENAVTQMGGLVFAEYADDRMSHRVSFSQFEVEKRDPGGFVTQFNGDRQEIAYLGSWAFGVDNRISFGVERTEESYDTSLSPGGSVTENSAKAELLLRPTDTLDLSYSLRYDDRSDFGDHYSGRIAAAWRPGTEWIMRAVAGTGYRAPSLDERFASYGNPSLQPEESTSFELGLEYGLGDAGSLKATAFYIGIEDRIDWDTAIGTYNQVPGTTTTQGVEVEGRYALTQSFTIYGAYTYTDAKTEGERLVKTPRHDALVGVEAAFENGLGGHLDIRHVADVLTDNADIDHKVGDHTLVNAGLSLDLNANTALYLRGENLLDEDYQTSAGYNMPGRSLFVGLRAGY